jgi:hypothetical protein
VPPWRIEKNAPPVKGVAPAGREKISGKAHAISVLLIFNSRIQGGDGKFPRRLSIHVAVDFVPSWEIQSGSGIQFGAVTQVVGFR